MFCPFCGHHLGTVRVFCGSCGKNVHFLAEVEDNRSASDSPTEEDLIQKYFHDGYSYNEILDFLATNHNVTMSLCSLKTFKLKHFSLSRQKNYSPLATVHAAIQEELKGPGAHYGYRLMWQTLRQKYHLTVRRDDVMALMGELDPSGVQLRAGRRFVRRVYSSRGPNHAWHVDSYDKLNPFGLAISGCIDGYSRKVLWLLCGPSNNDPVVIAQNYLHCVSECGIIPMRLHTDCGTENGTMVAIHCALRSSHTYDFAGAASHMYGSSAANQRIESWWSYFRKNRSQFWMDLLNDLRERHLFSGSHEHTCLMRFVFMGVLQKDLDDCRENGTHIPSDLSSSLVVHLANQMSCTTCLTGLVERTVGSQSHRRNWASLWLCHPTTQCGDDHLQAHFEDLQRRSGLMQPLTWESCVENYIRLKNMADM